LVAIGTKRTNRAKLAMSALGGEAELMRRPGPAANAIVASSPTLRPIRTMM
jgi:hypothetical protein